LRRFPQIHSTYYNNKAQMYFGKTERLLLLMLGCDCEFLWIYHSERYFHSALMSAGLFSGVKSE
jgi:hypothetical protein